MHPRLLSAIVAVVAFVSPTFAFIPPPPPPPPPPPAAPPPAVPPVVVPGLQVLPSAIPTMPGGTVIPRLSCNFCRIDENDDIEASKRLAYADEKVTVAALKVAPDGPDEFERRMAAARKCGGERAPAECEIWRAAVKERSEACAALEAHRKNKPPRPAARNDGRALPVIEMGATERAATVGQKLDLVGAISNFDQASNVRVNGQPVALTETRNGGPAAPVTRSFKINVPTDRAGTGIYVVEARDGTDNCFGKDVIARILE